MTFGARLRKLREQKRWTQQQLAEKTGISPRVLGYYENDQRLTSAISAITRLSCALKTTPDYLILGTRTYYSSLDRPYDKACDAELWVSDAQHAFLTVAYSPEELQVLDRARKSGISASQLIKTVDFLHSLHL